MATDPTTLPSVADLQQTKKSMTDIDSFIDSSNNSFTDNNGQSRKTLTGIENDANKAVLNFNLSPSGFSFTTGGLLLSNTNTIFDDLGNAWVYTGEIPENGYIVAAGTVPSEPTYKQVTFNEASNVSYSENGNVDNALRKRGANYTLSEVQSLNLEVDQKVTLSDFNNAMYQVVDISDTGGFYLNLNASKKLKYIVRNGIAYISHTPANSTTDSAVILRQMAAAGFRTINIDIDVLCETGGYVIPETLTITGDGKFIADWSKIGYGTLDDEVFVYKFTGDKVLYKHVDSEGINYDVPFVEQEFTSFLLFTGDRSKVRHTDGSGHPNYTFAFMSDEGKFDFISNTGVGQLEPNTSQTAVHCLLQQRNGTNSVHNHNEGERYSNVILHGFSPQNSTVNNNIGRDCGEHVFYGSSSDYCHAQANEGYGENTSLKIRGDYNVAINNIIEGGTFGLTNRVVDTGNGYALNKVTSIGNVITCRRDNAVAYKIGFRTGYDGAVRDIVSTGNTVNAFYSGANAHLIIFDSMRYVQCSDDVVCSNTITDGIRISPTDGISAGKVNKIQIDSSKSIGASDQAYQLVGSSITMNNFHAESGGGTGVSSGCITITVSRFTASLFDINYSDNTYGINFRAVTTATLDNGVIERPSGGTLPHIINTSGGGTVTEGSLITKIN